MSSYNITGRNYKIMIRTLSRLRFTYAQQKFNTRMHRQLTFFQHEVARKIVVYDAVFELFDRNEYEYGVFTC